MQKVLIVDDEPLLREALALTVSGTAGFRIVGEADTGKKAVKLSQTIMPDIVFMDIKLPDMDGLEASELIKRSRPKTQIVILTAHEDFQSVKRGIELGVLAYLLKPCSFEGIKTLLTDIKGTRLKKVVVHNGFLHSMAEKRFKESSDMIEEVILRLFDASKDTNEKHDGFRSLFMDMFGLVPSIDRDYIAQCENKFALSDTVCNDPVQAEFLLFDILDEVFRQRCIKAHWYFTKIFEYIDDNINHEILMSSAAKYANLSASYLSRIFKGEMGVSFSSYVNIKKVRVAKQLLMNSNIFVNEVAFNVGFNEPNYFCKVFRKVTSKTPTQYRDTVFVMAT